MRSRAQLVEHGITEHPGGASPTSPVVSRAAGGLSWRAGARRSLATTLSSSPHSTSPETVSAPGGDGGCDTAEGVLE